jgi:hypothetical protein
MEEQQRITRFAVTDYRDIRKLFGIKERNRRHHIYVVGKTGTGKSTLIHNMAVSDIYAGCGMAVIDPHGDLAEGIMDCIPESRIADVIYFNPADSEYPVAFNPLENVPADQRHLVASKLISVFKKIWHEFWGPRLEHILRHAVLTLMEYPDGTLLDIPRLLTDKDFRQAILPYIKHQQVREFWFTEFEKYSTWFRSEAVSPILNKVGLFLTSDLLRNIVGQKKNAFNLRQAMDEGKILIVNLAKGKIGEDNASLLGSLLVAEIYLSALSRADMPEKGRQSFYLYVDEFHNFMTLSFADILSEARKYGLSLVLAHQYLEQLDEKIRAAVFGNVGTIITFRVGNEDAKYLVGEFGPVFDEHDLSNLENYHIYLKLMIDGVTSKPFSAVTLPSPDVDVSHREKIVELSRARFAKKREDIEKAIMAARFRPPAEPEKPRQSRLL